MIYVNKGKRTVQRKQAHGHEQEKCVCESTYLRMFMFTQKGRKVILGLKAVYETSDRIHVVRFVRTQIRNCFRDRTTRKLATDFHVNVGKETYVTF